jgi:hypothetical protein
VLLAPCVAVLVARGGCGLMVGSGKGAGWPCGVQSEVQRTNQDLVTTPAILATQEARSGGSWFKVSPRKIVCETLS